LKALLKLAVAAAIVISTWYAILEILETKADALAGGDTFALEPAHAEEMRHFRALLDQIERWEEPDLARTLVELRESGHLWVAPGLEKGRSAVYVDTLGLVTRVYVRRDELVARELPFPDLDAPEAAQRTFATIRLAGTLFHELQHYEGLEDEDATYEREIAWYRGLRETVLDTLHGEQRMWFEWAVDSALESVVAAREKATASSG
jgi:hypothetical protein